MEDSPSQYSENMVREFDVSYIARVNNMIPKRGKELAQPPFFSTVIGDVLVDIS